MRSGLFALIFSVSAMLIAPWNADAQFRRPGPPGAVEGIYLSAANQNYCFVARRADGYLFVDEFGGMALFDFISPNRLGIVATTDADPNIVATVGRDVLGRQTIRFDAPGQIPAFWVLAR
jgi:hypothetical protein